MARIRKIPDTWTIEIHAIVLKDSRQAEHEEIGCMNTTRRSSVYSNIKRGGRGAQKERNARNKTTRQNEAQRTRTSNVVGEELKRKKRSKQKDTTRRSSAYSNIKRGGRGAQKKETLETKRHYKTKLSVLEHQTWWERSSKERNARNKKTRQNEGQYTRTSNVVGEELKKKKKKRNARNKNDTTR